jgi:DNA replication licensing factor MCM6
VLVDELTEEEDGRIAQHIVALHKDPAATMRSSAAFSMEQLQRYIKYARAIKPQLSPEVRDCVCLLVACACLLVVRP